MGCLKLEILEKYDNLKITFRAKNSVFLGDLDYYPFGMQMPGRSFNSPEYRFGAQGSEKDDEITGVTGSHITTFYREADLRIGQWWTPDNVSPNPSESPYAMMGRNPILYNDPKGDIIRIYYKEKKGIARLFERRKSVDYNPNNTPTVNNAFVQDVYKGLNYIINNKADVNNAIIQVVNSTEVVKVVKGSSDTYDPEKNKVTWTGKGMSVWNETEGTEGRQSGALGIFHEITHGFIDLFYGDTRKTELEGEDPNYDYNEEKEVIEKYETPAAKILGEGTRDNHDGGASRKYSDVTSTKTKREIKREAKKTKTP